MKSDGIVDAVIYSLLAELGVIERHGCRWSRWRRSFELLVRTSFFFVHSFTLRRCTDVLGSQEPFVDKWVYSFYTQVSRVITKNLPGKFGVNHQLTGWYVKCFCIMYSFRWDQEKKRLLAAFT